MDQATTFVSRPSVAHVLVELDVSKKHPNEIWIGFEFNGYFQKVKFENLPIFCSHFKMYGHDFNECFRLHPHLRKEKDSSKKSKGKDVLAVEHDSDIPIPNGNEGIIPKV
ncbi:hypothetical protein MA16_Dca019691 [Dendrobium catenatum]|uniref:Zinc knuckle CX2CX4HX4C domain-containing protein n=1 Tax=Dendrobium catenatum TaxID=906689 RepID=A0A2I0VDH1_9ASPA|nr:hypothetical protein MA16_Dca019691 [Dendrobium catenatum]